MNEKNLGVISSLGKRYIAIDSTDTCWDTEYLRVTKISTIRQWFGAKTVNLWLQNEFDNRRIIQPEQLILSRIRKDPAWQHHDVCRMADEAQLHP